MTNSYNRPRPEDELQPCSTTNVVQKNVKMDKTEKAQNVPPLFPHMVFPLKFDPMAAKNTDSLSKIISNKNNNGGKRGPHML